MRTAVYLRVQFYARVLPADIESPYPFWAIDFVGGKGGKVYFHRLDVKRDLADSLGGVCMEKDPTVTADRPDGRHVLNDSDLVVRRHDSDEDCVTRKGIFQLVQIDQAICGGRQVSDAESLGLQAIACVQNRLVLSLSCNNVVALFGISFGDALDGEVVRLGSAGRENDLPGIR